MLETESDFTPETRRVLLKFFCPSCFKIYKIDNTKIKTLSKIAPEMLYIHQQESGGCREEISNFIVQKRDIQRFI